MKKFICLFLSFVLLCSIPVQAKAQQNSEVMPMFENINSVYASISIDQTWGITTCTGRIVAAGEYPVSVDVILQMYKDNRWTTLATWSASSTWVASCTQNYAVYSGYQYRVLVYGYVYDANGRIIESGSAVHSAYYPAQ